MTEKLHKGLGCAAWGCLFLYLNLNLGRVNVLPQFVGYLLMLGAIRNLGEEYRDFKLLEPLGAILAGWAIADWVLTLLGIELSGKLPVVELILTVVSLYFSFQLYTDLAQIAREKEDPVICHSKKILTCRNIQTVVATFIALPIRWNEDSTWQMFLLFPVIVAAGIAGICQMCYLFAMRKQIANCTPEE